MDKATVDKRQKSRIMQNALTSKLLVAIMDFERSNNYDFKPCEVSKVLISLLDHNAEIDLKASFGTDTQR